MNGINSLSAAPALLGSVVFLAVCVVLAVWIAGKRIRQLRKQAQTDPVTGGLNTFGFDQQARKLFSGRAGQYALVVMRLENYRQIMQTFGCEKTDAVLR